MVTALTATVAVDDTELARAHATASAVLDPEIPILTLADLGVVRSTTRRGSEIIVSLTPTYTGCPATAAIQMDVEAALLAAGIPNASVETVLSPPWTTDDITEGGRQKLKAYGIAPPNKGSPAMLFADEHVECPKCGSGRTSRISEFGSTACKALWRCDACREPFDYFKCHR